MNMNISKNNFKIFFVVAFLLFLLVELKLIVCDDSEKALQLMSFKSNLETIVIIEKISDEARAKAAEANIKLYLFEELKSIGSQKLKSPVVS